MSKPNVYGHTLNFENDWLLVRALLKVYSLTVNIEEESNFLRPKLVDALAYYVILGYSDSTKEVILKTLKIKKTNLNQINAELRQKKLLVRDRYNFRKNYLSEDLESLKQYFLDSTNANKLFLIKFKKT